MCNLKEVRLVFAVTCWSWTTAWGWVHPLRFQNCNNKSTLFKFVVTKTWRRLVSLKECKSMKACALHTSNCWWCHVLQLGRWCRRSPSKVALHRLLHGAAIDLPSLPEPKPDPELQERLVKLRQERDQLLYDRMVSNVSRKSASARNRRAPFTSGINFGVTLVASVFVAVFILRGLVDGLMMRVAIGLAVGTVIMCIEIYLAVRAVEKDESTR